MATYKAIYRSPRRKLDFVFVAENLDAAVDASRQFFRGIGLFGRRWSSLKVRRVHTAEEALLPSA